MRSLTLRRLASHSALRLAMRAAVFLGALGQGMSRPASIIGAEAAHAADPASTQASELSFVSPSNGDIVPALLEVELRIAGVTDDIHLLATDDSTPGGYRYLERIAAPLSARSGTLRRFVDTAALGSVGYFRLVAVASSRLVPSPAGLIDAQTLVAQDPIDIVEVRHAAAILLPAAGAQLDSVDLVRATGFLPGSHIAAVVRPAIDGGYWVQGTSTVLRPGAPTALRTHLGGNDTYDLYLGVTFDPGLLQEGDRLIRLPALDGSGKPVYWVGPIGVTRR